MHGWFQAKQKPWVEGESILEQIRRWNGKQPLRLVEPAIVPSNKEAEGAEKTDEARVVTEFLELIRLLMFKGNEQARGMLYEAAALNSITSACDVVLHELNRQSWWQASNFRPHARWLIMESRHREPLGFGIALIGLSGTEEDVELLSVLSRHEEFTIAAANAVTGIIKDPTMTWWNMAKQCSGWGKVHLVKRTARRCDGKAEIQSWLLREGWRNDVSPEYVAYACASAGKLDQALQARHVDDELLHSACVLINAMLSAGQAENLEDYEGGVAAISCWLHHVESRKTDAFTKSTLRGLSAWLSAEHEPRVWERREEQLGWTPKARQGTIAICQRILERY